MEPELPPLSQSTRSAAADLARSRVAPPLTRKRTHPDQDDEAAMSSDPALFSSDEAAPGAENYVLGKRKKRTFKGSWWDRHPAEPGTREGLRERRQFRRNFDSGIFMGSESEDALSSDPITIEEEFLRDQREDKDNGKRTGPFASSPEEESQMKPRTKLDPRTMVQIPKEHEQVCKIIRQCLDRGKEDVDLSSMSLSSLPADVTSLQTLSKQDELAPGMLDIGTNLEPQLRLFLGNNCFTRVPTPIFSLHNLRVLSLRNNNLTYIPSAIGELVNLESLNIAGNQLSELPSEILDLVTEHKLQELRIHPNPWRIVDGVTIDKIICWDFFGDIAFRRPQARVFEKSSLFPPNSPQIPTLTELALLHLASYDPLGDIDFVTYMPPNTPENVLNQLRLLRQQPARRCTACKKRIVLAREEWLEYWFIEYAENGEFPALSDLFLEESVPVPFRRIRCWECSRSSKLSDAKWDMKPEDLSKDLEGADLILHFGLQSVL
ncbi:uncharacterized protein PV07_01854 [Cladophialophora immunda]|uniref:Uncharacterized protein n=1 Tax=Cladophialophora immunda TaxID=569365 RepID=A0A0D2DHA7_9EURO|nr:uncharacterized protein PV07_01854 [Cladophialophora immunda]KIW35139.1 hypothetical protein PV07_01854 [Cladophialophora immunda]